MGWNLGWILWGGLAVLCFLVHLVRLTRNHSRGWQILTFASLACIALTMLDQYRMAARWAQMGDFAALSDVLPTLLTAWSICVWAGIALNLVLMACELSREKHAK